MGLSAPSTALPATNIGQLELPQSGLRGWLAGLSPRDRAIYGFLLALLMVIVGIYAFAGVQLLLGAEQFGGWGGDQQSPVATVAPATATTALPSATPVPPSATRVPPTDTAEPPTATPVPPTATPVPPTATVPVFVPPPVIVPPPTLPPPTPIPASPTPIPASPTPEPPIEPTAAPIEPTAAPTDAPTEGPTDEPAGPTEAPTDVPAGPTEAPTDVPAEPTEMPTDVPAEPTEVPTDVPAGPTEAPTDVPTQAPPSPTLAVDGTPVPLPTPEPARPTPGTAAATPSVPATTPDFAALLLYFDNPDRTLFVPVVRAAPVASRRVAEATLRELIAGPRRVGLVAALPANVQVRDVRRSGSTLIVDFDRRPAFANDDRGLVAIALTLTELPGVRQVQIQVNGTNLGPPIPRPVLNPDNPQRLDLDFSSGNRFLPLYFLANGYRVRITRVVPRTTEIARVTVEELLAGPGTYDPWLDRAIPAGTTLRTISARGTRVIVDLSGAFASAANRRAAVETLTLALTELRDNNGVAYFDQVEILIDSRPLAAYWGAAYAGPQRRPALNSD